MLRILKRHKDGIILVALILALMQYIWISFFVHPIADDFNYAFKGKNYELLSSLKNEYLNWNGRYISNIFVLINPIAYNNL